MYVIGTAGHIDHGKSALIKALTGIDPDRLKEEKERGMTIDLGFAWFRLPSGREAGVVDVPGHHRFIKNMLAGVSGINLTLFVVDASEGWMPQSEEHLQILDLLEVRRGICVLTKRDLVDRDWLELVNEEVRSRFDSTCLRGLPVLAVSAITGEGLDELVRAIDLQLLEVPPPPDFHRPRLFIDRAFVMRGAGTVVTGTLEGGSLEAGQEAEILPSGGRARIRGLQTYGKAVFRAEPSTRVAVNLAGAPPDMVGRGSALGLPGQWFPSRAVDVKLVLAPTLSLALRRTRRLRAHVGTADLSAYVELLEREELLPGETGLATVRFERGIPLRFGDRLIFRDPGIRETVGGAFVLEPFALVRKGPGARLRSDLPQRFLKGLGLRPRLSWWEVRLSAVDRLAGKDTESAGGLILRLLKERPYLALEHLPHEVPVPAGDIGRVVEELGSREDVVVMPSHIMSLSSWESLCREVTKTLAKHHAKFPLQAGISLETLRNALGLDENMFGEVAYLLTSQGRIVSDHGIMRLSTHEATLTSSQQSEAERLLDVLLEMGYSPPEQSTLVQELGFTKEIIDALVHQGKLVRITRTLLLSRTQVESLKTTVADYVLENGSIDVASLRDLLKTSRKFAVPIMEFLDQAGFTVRVGDQRVLREPASLKEASS